MNVRFGRLAKLTVGFGAVVALTCIAPAAQADPADDPTDLEITPRCGPSSPFPSRPAPGTGNVGEFTLVAPSVWGVGDKPRICLEAEWASDFEGISVDFKIAPNDAGLEAAPTITRLTDATGKACFTVGEDVAYAEGHPSL